MTLRHQFAQKPVRKSISGGNLLRQEVSSPVSPVPRRDVPTATASPDTQPSSSASPQCQFLCELLGSLLLCENLGWCSEETAPGTLRAQGLWPALLGQPWGREGSCTLPSRLLLVQLDTVCSRMNVMQCLRFFFFNLKWLVKTLKQWIDAHWKLFSSCLRSQEQSYWMSFQECAFKVKNV